MLLFGSTENFKSYVNLTQCMFLDCWRKPKYPERTYKVHTGRPQLVSCFEPKIFFLWGRKKSSKWREKNLPNNKQPKNWLAIFEVRQTEQPDSRSTRNLLKSVSDSTHNLRTFTRVSLQWQQAKSWPELLAWLHSVADQRQIPSSAYVLPVSLCCTTSLIIMLSRCVFLFTWVGACSWVWKCGFQRSVSPCVLTSGLVVMNFI